MIQTIIALVFTIAYITIATWRNNWKVLPSLSESFYIFGNKPKGYVFYGYLVLMIMLLLPPMLDKTPELWQFTAFFAIASLGFVGAAADFKNHEEKKVHFTAAYISAIFAIIWCSLVMNQPYISAASMVAAVIMAFIQKENRLFWLEMGCFLQIFLTMLF